MALALFDLDNTLLGGDSDHAWGEFLVREGVVDGDVFRAENDRFYLEYQEGRLDILSYLEFALRPLTRFSMEELAALHRRFMVTMIEPMILPRGEALLARHREAGDRLLIITATNAFVTRPIAERLEVPALLATEPEIRDGRYTGGVAGTPCFREGKLQRLRQWLAQSGESLDGASFYSDSHNDLPLLRAVSRPVAVDPDPALAAEAAQREWPVISLRH